MINALETDINADVRYTDFAKASDKVNHTILTKMFCFRTFLE